MTTIQEIAARYSQKERMTRFGFGPVYGLRYGVGDPHFPALLYALVDLGVIDFEACDRSDSGLRVGDRVAKRTGDYHADGEVLAVFFKRDGTPRIVVEFDVPRGLCFVMRPDQVERMTHQPGGAESINRESIPKPSRPTLLDESLPPIPGIYFLAISDVGRDDDDQLEHRALALELDIAGCLDARLP